MEQSRTSQAKKTRKGSTQVQQGSAKNTYLLENFMLRHIEHIYCKV
jgi:hypothetical protein